MLKSVKTVSELVAMVMVISKRLSSKPTGLTLNPCDSAGKTLPRTLITSKRFCGLEPRRLDQLRVQSIDALDKLVVWNEANAHGQ
jgi:hypothetical protein